MKQFHNYRRKQFSQPYSEFKKRGQFGFLVSLLPIWGHRLSRNLCAVTQLPLILRIDDMRRHRGRLASAYLFLSLLGNYCTSAQRLLGTY